MSKFNPIPAGAFERMQILARANGFKLKSESEVLRICFLADSFREVYGIPSMRKNLEQRLRSRNHRSPVDACPTISAAPLKIIRRGKEVAENRQR